MQGFCRVGQSDPVQLLATTQDDLERVSDLAASEVTSNSVTLQFTPVANAPTHRIDRSPDQVSWESLDIVDTGTTEPVEFEDDSVDPETDYYYRIAGFRGGGCGGPWSQPLMVTTGSACESPPRQSRHFSGITSSEFTMEWTPAEGHTYWEISYTPEGGIETMVGTDETVITLTGLEECRDYTVKLQGFCLPGEGVSSVITRHVETRDNLARVLDLAAPEITDNYIQLTFTPVENAFSTVIERSLDGDLWDVVVTAGTDSGDPVQYYDTQLDPATTYYYRVIWIQAWRMWRPHFRCP